MSLPFLSAVGAFLPSFKAFETLHRTALAASEEVAHAHSTTSTSVGLIGSAGPTPAAAAAAQSLALIAGSVDASPSLGISDTTSAPSSSAHPDQLTLDSLLHDPPSSSSIARQQWEGMRGAAAGMLAKVSQPISARLSHPSKGCSPHQKRSYHK